MDSIGQTLRAEREKRGLTLDDAHESTKITIQNISALEEDRFDSFPNKVYARAFLRDYSNFLGLDSAELLTEYEEKWSPKPVPESIQEARPSRFARALGYSVLVLVIAAALGAGGYFGWQKLQDERKSDARAITADAGESKPEGAVIPKAPKVEPPKTETQKAAEPKPKPEAPAEAPKTLKLDVTALLPVWTEVKVDGQSALYRTVAKGERLSFEGKKSIYIKTGMAGAVQLKLNGELQPPLGSLKVRGEKTFLLPASPASTPPASPSGEQPAPGN